MWKLAVRFKNDISGAATMEYGLIAAGLSLAIATVLQGIGARIAFGADPSHILLRQD
jgi:Flp pilus assembly pilin Flp